MSSNADLLKNFRGKVLLRDASPELAKAVQACLVKGGYLSGTIDGKVGPITMKAFHQFKQASYLDQLNYLGQTTAQALLKIESSTPTSGVNLKVPYLSQRDNEYRPSGTCNITSVAMCLQYFGIKQTTKPQLEDELFLKLKENGWRRHYHSDLNKLFHLYGVNNTFYTECPWSRIKEHLAKGNPVIYSGKFTSFGHIIVIRGYDHKGWWVNDPWGEYFSSGYVNKSGANLHYSYDLLQRLSYSGRNHGWAHLPSKK
ncbi:C39 family peptidase [Calothrix rhizosoleniae]|uniref:C39 family peptidase n=1 Tax=Calothrix rhizosoleniae TaxID=888997 RepID=UPI000B4A45AA|nr:C39 family peptidase [Calothrix rhizosoleniae]